MTDRLALLTSMIEKGSMDPFVWYARAMELRGRGELVEALARYDEVAAKFPDYVPTYLMGGQVAEELEEHEIARAWFTRGITVAQAQGDGHAQHELQAALDDL